MLLKAKIFQRANTQEILPTKHLNELECLPFYTLIHLMQGSMSRVNE